MENNKFIKGIYNEYLGKKLQAAAELEVYLTNPAGIGEHSKLSDEVKDKLETIVHYDGVINLIDTLIAQNKQQSEAQQKTKELVKG